MRHGALQAANVLNSAQTNKLSVYIVRAFVHLRETALPNGVDQPGEEASFAFLCGAVAALTALKSGVEQVPEDVAEHVEGVDDNRQEKPRPEGQPGGLLHEAAPFPAEHPSPAGHLDGQPESEEAQRRLGNDDPADVDAEDDDDRCHDIGNQEDFAYHLEYIRLNAIKH